VLHQRVKYLAAEKARSSSHRSGWEGRRPRFLVSVLVRIRERVNSLSASARKERDARRRVRRAAWSA
jgi:hypothetical protein